jgi:hypothetical protein
MPGFGKISRIWMGFRSMCSVDIRTDRLSVCLFVRSSGRPSIHPFAHLSVELLFPECTATVRRLPRTSEACSPRLRLPTATARRPPRAMVAIGDARQQPARPAIAAPASASGARSLPASARFRQRSPLAACERLLPLAEITRRLRAARFRQRFRAPSTALDSSPVPNCRSLPHRLTHLGRASHRTSSCAIKSVDAYL